MLHADEMADEFIGFKADELAVGDASLKLAMLNGRLQGLLKRPHKLFAGFLLQVNTLCTADTFKIVFADFTPG